MEPIFFDSIEIPAPSKEIFRRMGFKRGKTQLSPTQAREIENYMDDALSDIQLKGAGVRIPVCNKSVSEIALSSGYIIQSVKLANMLSRSNEILLIGATAGPNIMETIRQDSTRNNLTRAVVLDAVAGEMADAALDWIIRYFNHELRRENKRLTNGRFSAGYGDFDIENQRWIYKALSLDRLGISLTESLMLIPEKSVTAIMGIEEFA